MKVRHFLFSVVMLVAVVGAGVLPAGASPTKSWIRDGYYAYTSLTPSAQVGITVTGNGTKALWQVGGISCTASSKLVALDPNQLAATSIITIHPPALTIAPSGAFSYHGDPKLTSNDDPVSASHLPVEVSGHFIKGTSASSSGSSRVGVVGTFSAPQICAPSSRTRFSLVW
jgi:hypothetical protein